MVVSANRFIPDEMQCNDLLQPECPVLVYCSRRCTEQESGAVFAQVRMVNRTDVVVQTVLLQIEGMQSDGEVSYTMRHLFLAHCNAAPHSMFGEQRMIALQRTPVAALRITVERVIFSDGTNWCSQPESKLMTAEQAGWSRCSCGMLNPQENTVCDLCGAELRNDQPAPAVQYQPEQPILYRALPNEENPATVIRQYYPVPVSYDVEEEPEAPKWLVVLLSILGALALAAAVGFFIYCIYFFM